MNLYIHTFFYFQYWPAFATQNVLLISKEVTKGIFVHFTTSCSIDTQVPKT